MYGQEGSKFTFKIITAGDGGVGKTTLLRRYVEGKFTIDTIMTIGVGFFYKNVDIGDKNQYSLQLWDFGGEQHFRNILDSYAQGAMGAILMIDLTRLSSTSKLDEWVDIIRGEDPTIPIVFVGSKSDLVEKISIKDEFIEELKEKYGFIAYYKTSSKTGLNVDKVFQEITRWVVKHRKIA